VSVELFLHCCGRFARQFPCGIGYDPTALPASPRGERAVFEEDKFSRHDSEKFAIRRWEFASTAGDLFDQLLEIARCGTTSNLLYPFSKLS